MENKQPSLKEMFERANEYNDLADIGKIARRAFANNSFDGVLTIIGVLMGSYTAGIKDAWIVVNTGLTTAVAIGISGFWGSYLAETAERKKEIDELGRSTLTDLNGSKLGRASRFAVKAVSLVDGLSPFLASMVVLSPFFFEKYFASIETVYFSALGMALVALFALGMFLGKISKHNILVYGLKTMVAGVVSIIISTLISVRGK